MPNNRQKKRKLNNNNTAHNHNRHHVDDNQLLSHQQIWDDSALIDSWNSALAEYEYYHSLAAQGLDVKEVLDRAEEREEKGLEVDLMLGRGIDDGGGGGKGGGKGEGDGGEVEEGEVEEDGHESGVQKEGPTVAAPAGKEGAVKGGALLENVKMSYYWAGYYSGLYDARRKTSTAAGDAQQSSAVQ
ncbi:hypothetical protein DV737_g3670, partial [Chaetothyriales sp. CBS 132003]